MNLKLATIVPACLACVVTTCVVSWLCWPASTPQPAPLALAIPWVQAGEAALSDEQISSLGTLREIAGNARRPAVQRVQAMYHLAEQRDWDSIDVLLVQLDDDSPLVRGRAAAAIRQILGTDFLYHADDERNLRLEQIDGIRRYWDSRKENPPLMENGR